MDLNQLVEIVPWAISAILLLLNIILYWVYRKRNRKLKAERDRLQSEIKLVEKRTIMMKELADKVGRTKASVRKKNRKYLGTKELDDLWRISDKLS